MSRRIGRRMRTEGASCQAAAAAAAQHLWMSLRDNMDAGPTLGAVGLPGAHPSGARRGGGPVQGALSRPALNLGSGVQATWLATCTPSKARGMEDMHETDNTQRTLPTHSHTQPEGRRWEGRRGAPASCGGALSVSLPRAAPAFAAVVPST
eukprot:1505693-Pyramimonas_sp.AAC.1